MDEKFIHLREGRGSFVNSGSLRKDKAGISGKIVCEDDWIKSASFGHGGHLRPLICAYFEGKPTTGFQIAPDIGQKAPEGIESIVSPKKG